MVVYNELVAVTAGAGLLGFAAFLSTLIKTKRVDSEGWAAFFGVTGVLLLVLGLHTTMTWPFGGDGFEYANIAFGQPAAGFGALLLLTAVYLWRNRSLFAGDVEAANASALASLKPAGIFVGALGLGMAVLAITFVRFQLGAAPPGGTHQRTLRPPADPRGALPRRPVGRRRPRCTALRPRPVDRATAAAALGRVGLGDRRRGVPAVRRDELLHAHRHVPQHRLRHVLQVVSA